MAKVIEIIVLIIILSTDSRILSHLLFLAGIYEIFCKETFGVKAKNLEFGLQPYKIPETETV